jgi:hypothetical protein
VRDPDLATDCCKVVVRSDPCVPGFRTGWRGLIAATLASLAPEGRPMSVNAASPSAARPASATTTRIWGLTVNVT